MSIPKKIRNYQILAELGSGGMGVVYLAQAPRGERVALKVIRPELARNADFRRRFAREAAAAAAVTGSCTARVIDVDVDGATPYIATEFIDGPTLNVFVERHGPLQAEPLRAFALALAEGLAAIHRGGLIHRDLKPTNILLARSGPKVIDFGIAKAIEETSLTGTGITLGTPAWMAPEQARGQVATSSADIFAWGCLVAFAASGTPPFGYGSAEAMLYRVVHELPTVSGLPPDLGALVMRSLTKEPVGRPSLADIVSTLLADETVSTVDRTVSMRVADTLAHTWVMPDSIDQSWPKRRRRRTFIAAAMAILILSGTAAAFSMQAGRRNADASEPLPDPTAATSASEEEPEPQLPNAKDVDISTLLRDGTSREKVAYLDMDGTRPEEIVIVSAEHRGDVFSQRYLDIFNWHDGQWEPIMDATRYRPPGQKETVLPFGDPGSFGGRDVAFLKGIDFYGDGREELAVGIATYGATSGPLETLVFSKVDRRVRTDFTDRTDRGGTLTGKGDTLVLERGEYLPSDAMCCPSFMLRTVIGAVGGELRFIDTKTEPTEYYVPPLEEASLTLTSLGPLEIGMTIEEAEDSSGKQFSVGFDNGSCAYATPINGPRGISMMYLDGRLARIDVDEGNTTTLSGIGIGSSEAEVYATYPGRIRSEPHPYEESSGWNYLIYTPQDTSDQAYSMIFETDGQHVLGFRAGQRDAVSFIEGCF